MVWNFRSHGERLERQPSICKTAEQVDGLARTTKAKASQARVRAKASKTRAMAKANLPRATPRTRTKERVNATARKGRKDFMRWRNTKTRKKHKPVKNGRTRVGIPLTGLTQTGDRATGAQMCGLTLHGNKRHDSWHRRNLLKNSPIQRPEAAFQC